MENQEEEKGGISGMHEKHRQEMWAMQNWRSWGSWYSWGSPVGLGLFLVEIGLFILLIHLAGK